MADPTDLLKQMQQADHDLLIGIKVTLESFIVEYKQNRLDDASRYADHEHRIRALEDRQQQAAGGQISRKEIVAWVTLAAVIMGGLWWVPTIFQGK